VVADGGDPTGVGGGVDRRGTGEDGDPDHGVDDWPVHPDGDLRVAW
jgi:hypothetical protein